MRACIPAKQRAATESLTFDTYHVINKICKVLFLKMLQNQMQFICLVYYAKPQDSSSLPWRLEGCDSQGCAEKRETSLRRVL